LTTQATLMPTLLSELRSVPSLHVDDGDAARERASRDFGGLARGTVRAVARPDDVAALTALVGIARAEGLRLTPRSLGLSQSGQSIPVDGVSVDMCGFTALEIARDREVAICGSGTTWRRLSTEAAKVGLMPVVMPLNLDLSIGGTLSAGGMGSTSHRFGMAVSNVDSVGVVTGAGEYVASTSTRRPEVYNAVLGGAGQFGFICEAELRLRKMEPRTRTFYLLYDELSTMLADELRLMRSPSCTHLEGFASASIQGLKRGPTGRRVPFARWFYGLHVSCEHDGTREPAVSDFVGDLGYRELLHVEDNESVDFAARYDVRFDMMRATGAWDQLHPWVECLLAADVAAAVLPGLVQRLPLVLGDGHRIMALADVPAPELMARPGPGPSIGMAVLPAGVPKPFEQVALASLQAIHAELIASGAKRYLSGWMFDPGEAGWRRHLGDLYESWQERKRQLDPSAILESRLCRPT
jgi:cytokinin dehydrogenase